MYLSNANPQRENTFTLIAPPDGRRFRTVTNAIRQNTKALKDVNIASFCAYVGLDYTDDDGTSKATETSLEANSSAVHFGVGSRCYARYHDSRYWYWGSIKSMTRGEYFTCSVRYIHC
jgi:predicted transcriptional regulator